MTPAAYALAIGLALALAIAGPASAQDRPNPALTPGVADPAATVERICVAGYSATVRNTTAAMKLEVYRRYGFTAPRQGYCAGPEGCEVDHLISLELGGADAVENLWPQPYEGALNAHMKDRLENALHRLVCEGKLPFADAQREIAADWVAAYRKYVGEPQ